MGENSKIEWTDHTFSPWHGCSKVSAGCAHCYAEKMSHRNPKVLGVWGDHGTRVIASEAKWREPLKWDRKAAAAGERRRVFCASIADVFEDRPELVASRVRLFHLINATPNLDWLLLTKRPQNVRRMCGEGDSSRSWAEAMPPNVWLGTSCEDQATADERIPHLLRTPARVRFLSCEPLLSAVNLSVWLGLTRDGQHWARRADLRGKGLGISWVIAGGESGPKARPMHIEWARSLRDQCREAGVAFHFKQWGTWVPDGQAMPWLKDVVGARDAHEARDMGDGCIVRRVGKKSAGRLLDGVEWNELPRTVEAAKELEGPPE